jgi:formylglycine-generating enzyme required for sulfatase activity
LYQGQITMPSIKIKTRPSRARLFVRSAALAAAILVIGLLPRLTRSARAAGAPAAPATFSADRVEGKSYTQAIPGTDASFIMMAIRAGKFMMGSPASEKKRKPDEGPQFQVSVDAFWMGQCDVTQEQYTLFTNNYQRLSTGNGVPKIPADKLADAVTYPTPMYEVEAGPMLERMGRGRKYPAIIMSQFAARQFTKWLSKKTGHFYRLPTEAEWEYACRAGTTTAYSFGDDPKKLGEYGWYFDNSALSDGDGAYRMVGLKKPNPWGLYDMHGNVAQWVLDQYDPAWYKQFAGRSVSWHDVIDWPDKQYPHVLRGGSWNSEAEDCRSAARLHSDRKLNLRDPQIPQSPHWLTEGNWIGFRVVSPAVEPSEAEKHRCWDVDDANTRDILTRDREIREIVTPPGK